MRMSLLKSILQNVGVVLVGYLFGLVGYLLDLAIGMGSFASDWATIAGWLLVATGFAIRVWATFCFYEQRMKVISLTPQRHLLTSGPYRFSRNPLYLGGNLFIFLGAVLLFGSPMGLVLTAINMLAVEWMVRREERQLAQTFGMEWVRYKHQVHRWV